MYGLKYQGSFNNYNSNEIIINISKKDYLAPDVDDIEQLKIISCDVSYPNGEESKYGALISARATVSFYAGMDSFLTNETFLTDFYDEYKVQIICDGINVFEGFVEPSEGGYPLKDRPYIVEISCTDGLGLLKNIPLTDVNENNFNNRAKLIEYIAGALDKTNLELPIRTYCNIFNTSMSDRSLNDSNDMFNQTKVHHRTFLKNVNEFVSCYEALEIILAEAFTLHYWKGYWTINYVGELTSTSGRYYTNYSKEGVLINGGQDNSNQINVGKNHLIHPVNFNQLISYQVPVKSVKTIYEYDVPEDLVNNEKLQRLGSFVTLMNAYNIVGWGQFYDHPYQEKSISNKTPTIKIISNPYGYEMDRYYILPADSAANLGPISNYIRNLNDDCFVEAGDRIRITFDYKFLSNPPNNQRYQIFQLRLLRSGFAPTSTSGWRLLTYQGIWQSNQQNYTFAAERFNNEEFTEWQAAIIEETTIPFSGSLYLALGTGYIGQPNEIHIKNIKVEYISLAKGDNTNRLKGDYWLTSQDKNIKDTIEDTVKLSDATRRILKGALWNNDGVTLTNPTWYRYGKSESKHYKELINIAKYQHYRRRFKKISGTFKGILASPENYQADFSPLSFHKHFSFPDDLPGKRYVLVPPLKIDYVKSTFEGIFIECWGGDEDPAINWNTHNFNYIF